MFGKRLGTGSLVVAVMSLAIVTGTSGTALGQQGAAARKTRAKKSHARPSAGSSMRPRGGTGEKAVADRIVLRDGKELLGQVLESSPNAGLTILARRERVRTTLPGWV